MAECWAASLGGCSPESSREHYISAGLWDAPALDVIGLPWCRHEAIPVGIGSLTAKILCRHHNTLLSPVDQVGKQAFDALRKATALYNKRELRPGDTWSVARRQIDGPMMERWFAKTTVNLFTVLGVSWNHPIAGGISPPPALVEAAYGIRGLSKPMGLYVAANVGEIIHATDTVQFAPMFAGEQAIAGLFTFRGLRFVLYFGSEQLPRMMDVTMRGHGAETLRLTHHLPRMQWNVGDRESHYIQFLWPRGK